MPSSSSLLTRLSCLAAQRVARRPVPRSAQLNSFGAHPRRCCFPPSLLCRPSPSAFHSLRPLLSTSSSPPLGPHDDDAVDKRDDVERVDEVDVEDEDQGDGEDDIDGVEVEEMTAEEMEALMAELTAESDAILAKAKERAEVEEDEELAVDWEAMTKMDLAELEESLQRLGEEKAEEDEEGEVDVSQLANTDWDAESDPITATEFSDDMDDIMARVDEELPLTVNQKVVLIEHWLDKLEGKDPREGFGVHPLVTWTHPRGPGQRPAREAPRLEERHVPFPYSPAVIDAMAAESKAKVKKRRGPPSAYVLQRAVYREKMRDVRKAYMAEFSAIKARRDADIAKDWRALKTAAAERRQTRAVQQRLDTLETQKREEEEYRQRLVERRERIEARVRETVKQRELQAEEAQRMLSERRRRWINDTPDDHSWGVRIDERLFAQSAHNLVGFWPTIRR